MPGNTCAFRGCHSKEGQGISMFTFPKDPERTKLWLEACYRTDLLVKIPNLYKCYVLCELHFEERYISKGLTRKRLLPNAQPSIFPIRRVDASVEAEETKSDPTSGEPSKEVIDLTVSASSSSNDTICDPLTLNEEIEGTEIPLPLPSSIFSSQTPLYLSSNTPRKQKLKRKIRSLQQQLVRKKRVMKEDEDHVSVEKFNQLCDVFLDQPLADIIKSHVAQKGKKRTFHSDSMELKQFALKLYFLSPRAYNYISKILTLPTKRSLGLTERLSGKPGLENN